MFEPEFDLTSEAAMRWHAAIQLIHTEVFHNESLVRRGQGIGAVEDLVMSSLLHLQPSNYHSAFTQPLRPDKRGAVVQAAIDYLDDHLAEHVTMDSVAHAVHMSVRAVQQGFHEQLGMSPMTYLRERRLERVHEELIDATPADGVTVTASRRTLGFPPPRQLRRRVPQAVGRVAVADAAPLGGPRVSRYAEVVRPVRVR